MLAPNEELKMRSLRCLGVLAAVSLIFSPVARAGAGEAVDLLLVLASDV